MNADSESRLNAFEKWCYGKLLKIPRTEFATNIAVLARAKIKNRTVVEDIKIRKQKYIVHKIIENGIFILAVQGRIQGKPITGRKKSELINTNLPSNFPCKNLCDTIKYAKNRKVYAISCGKKSDCNDDDNESFYVQLRNYVDRINT